MVEFTVIGTPAPQGSKRFLGVRGGKGILVESSKAVKPWREAVKYEALEVGIRRKRNICGPVELSVIFTLPKPKSAKKDAYPCKQPDLSKLIRSTEDAVTDAALWEDDARVVSITASKLYVGDEGALPVPGAWIKIRSAQRTET